VQIVTLVQQAQGHQLGARLNECASCSETLCEQLQWSVVLPNAVKGLNAMPLAVEQVSNYQAGAMFASSMCCFL
jgi:hypothetical protein